MSKDPLDELFGVDDEAEGAPTPVSARNRLQQEQSERVRATQQAPTQKIRAQKNEARTKKMGPWLLVGAVVVIAIIVSIVTVNMSRGSEPARVAESPRPSTAEPSSSPEPSTTEAPVAPEPSEEPTDGPPEVEVGETLTLNIAPWGVTSELSSRFGTTNFNIPDGTNLVLTSDLLSQFPDSCSDLRDGWGATKNGNSYEVLKPSGTCAESPGFYDEIWGLIAAWVATIKPV